MKLPKWLGAVLLCVLALVFLQGFVGGTLKRAADKGRAVMPSSTAGMVESSSTILREAPVSKAFQAYRATKIVRGCVHFIPHPGIVIVTSDYCATGTAYLYYATPTTTYIERFDTGQGQPVAFAKAPYAGTSIDESGFESWSFK